MPTPASQPDVQRFASPVPRYSVLLFFWVGSIVSTPTEFWPRSAASSWCQSGFGPSALLARQIPPPAAPAQTRQPPPLSSPWLSSLPWLLPLFLPQPGSTASAVMRLAVLFVAPENARTPV